MSYSFQARFDTTQLTLPQILDKLAGSLDEFGIQFKNKASRLIEHEGWPTIDVTSHTIVQTQDLSEIGRLAAQWWGVSLHCLSLPLMQRLGRGDWMDVYIQIFRAPNNRWMLRYKESKTAHQHRLDSEDAARELYELQLRLCAALGFRFSVYDEEDDDLDPVPSLREIEHRLERCARGELGCSIAVATTEMNLHRAQALVGVHADLVRLSATGHILFPFLLPE
jgi:hypothetical protein